MKRIGDLMKELGFRPESSFDTQKAFINNLVAAANASQFQRKDKTIIEDKLMGQPKESKSKEPQTQLSFEFSYSSAEGMDPAKKSAG